MNTIAVGQKIKDNDPRHPNRVVTIVALDGDYAVYQAGQRRARVRLDRIHSDGKKRNTGYSLVV